MVRRVKQKSICVNEIISRTRVKAFSLRSQVYIFTTA